MTACIEAIIWAAAIEAKRRGQRIPAPMGGTPTHTDTDLVVEVRHLERVTHAYRHLADRARTLGDEPHLPPLLPTQMGGEQ